MGPHPLQRSREVIPGFARIPKPEGNLTPGSDTTLRNIPSTAIDTGSAGEDRRITDPKILTVLAFTGFLLIGTMTLPIYLALQEIRVEDVIALQESSSL